MGTFCLAKREAKRLMRDIRASLLHEPEAWTIREGTGPGQTVLEWGDYRVVISPCERCPCLAILDHCRLYYLGANVWLPKLSRMRLRAAARWAIAHKAVSGSI